MILYPAKSSAHCMLQVHKIQADRQVSSAMHMHQIYADYMQLQNMQRCHIYARSADLVHTRS